MRVIDIAIGKIDVIENVRVRERDTEIKDLMGSIKQNGLKEPIGVGQTKNGRYILMYGFRRLTAYKKLGYTEIPAVIDSEPDVKELLIINTIENVQRRNVSAPELGRICYRLREFNLSPGETAARLGLPISRIKVAMHVYGSLPANVRDRVKFIPSGAAKKGDISASAAYRIAQLRAIHKLSAATMTKMVEYARQEELNVYQLEILGALMNDGMGPMQALKELDRYAVVRLTFVAEKNQIEPLAKKHKTTNAGITRKIIYGEASPLKKPSIIR